MPYFRFIGDPRVHNAKWMEDHPGYKANDPASITFFATRTDPGINFVLNGRPVEVSDNGRVAKFRGHSHFEEVDSAEVESREGDSPKATSGQSGAVADPVSSEGSVPKKRGPGRPRKSVSQQPAG